MHQSKKHLLHFIGFFLFTAGGLIALRSGSFGANTQTALWALWVIQLVWGLWAYGPKNIKLGNIKIALAVLVVVQLGQYSLNQHDLDRGVFSPFDLFRYLVFIALVEEIWFRGVLQDWFGRNSLKAILITSVVFGFYHIHQGLGMVLTTACVGFLFSVARQAGAGLLAITIVHGVINWLNASFYPPVSLRVEYSIYLVLFAMICLVAGGVIIKIRSKAKENIN